MNTSDLWQTELSQILSLYNRIVAQDRLPVENQHSWDGTVSTSAKIEKSSCYREISNELITSERPMRTHNRQQMADAMLDADAVSPVIESTLSVSIIGRGRRGWFLFAIHTPQRPSGSTSSLLRCSLSATVVNDGGASYCHCFV